MFHSLSYRLPVELIAHIIRDVVARNDLAHILLVNKFCFQSSSRILYHTIDELSPSKSISLLKTLSSSSEKNTNIYPPLVRVLDLDWTECHLTGAAIRLLNDALRCLHNLTALVVDNYYLTTKIFKGCTFSLSKLTTTIAIDASLSEFLVTQPNIRELCLRNFRRCETKFILPPTALPRLNHFRALHAGSKFLADTVRGRPVENISLAMSMEETCDCLDALMGSSLPVKRLSIMFFDSPVPGELMPEITRRLPELEALHIVVLTAQYNMVRYPIIPIQLFLPESHVCVCVSQSILKETAPLLADFKHLKYITFVATGIPPQTSDEQNIASLWHEKCPTLRTIILPNGTVWFQKDGRWASGASNSA